ncbi:uncharacterized protein BX663DRAFT_62213 [Cokeromyces recurvatus]|uniref:uncharacterized protein n=1 Tax=Cokeromyces recurvatus TaxID=90255 RepID=UPI00221F1BA6|nr:uncharacterized protein BX663DRAFT_62213 [Cokeromyces recurvatus]KAI7902570.1 hypothetical protein BX663DRAFT_62213 [Cokeromyces recurvatus]
MSRRNPKGAALEQSHYESPEVVNCFNDIIEPLFQELKSLQRDLSLTAQDLSLLIGQLQQFQQDCLGAFNRPTNAPLRIPAKLLKVEKNTVLTTDSPIYTILLGAYTYRLKHGWKKWDFSNPAKKQRNADLVHSVRDLLIKSKFIAVPRITLTDSIDDSHYKIIFSLIKKIGGKK